MDICPPFERIQIDELIGRRRTWAPQLLASSTDVADSYCFQMRFQHSLKKRKQNRSERVKIITDLTHRQVVIRRRLGIISVNRKAATKLEAWGPQLLTAKEHRSRWA